MEKQPARIEMKIHLAADDIGCALSTEQSDSHCAEGHSVPVDRPWRVPVHVFLSLHNHILGAPPFFTAGVDVIHAPTYLKPFSFRFNRTPAFRPQQQRKSQV